MPDPTRSLNQAVLSQSGRRWIINLFIYIFCQDQVQGLSLSHSLSRKGGWSSQVKEAMDQIDNGEKLTYNLTSPDASAWTAAAADADCCCYPPHHPFFFLDATRTEFKSSMGVKGWELGVRYLSNV